MFEYCMSWYFSYIHVIMNEFNVYLKYYHIMLQFLTRNTMLVFLHIMKYFRFIVTACGKYIGYASL